VRRFDKGAIHNWITEGANSSGTDVAEQEGGDIELPNKKGPKNARNDIPLASCALAFGQDVSLQLWPPDGVTHGNVWQVPLFGKYL
jgi:hypothetical protein